MLVKVLLEIGVVEIMKIMMVKLKNYNKIKNNWKK